MLKKIKLGVIGAGFMSRAIVNGVLSSKSLQNSEILVSDISDDALNYYNELNVNTTKNNIDVFTQCKYVLFAIKPQTFYSIKDSFKAINNVKIISIMAGVKKSTIKSAFNGSLVVRCMPNTPCSVGNGAVGIDISDFKDETDVDFVRNLFSSIAKVVFVEEKQLNTVTAISGSSPAYFYLICKCIIDFGVKNGLSFEDAKSLVVNTMIGSGKMIFNNEKSLEELINAVCSKGGTTIAAMDKFYNSDFSDIINNALCACKNRAEELENNK